MFGLFVLLLFTLPLLLYAHLDLAWDTRPAPKATRTKRSPPNGVL